MSIRIEHGSIPLVEAFMAGQGLRQAQNVERERAERNAFARQQLLEAGRFARQKLLREQERIYTLQDREYAEAKQKQLVEEQKNQYKELADQLSTSGALDTLFGDNQTAKEQASKIIEAYSTGSYPAKNTYEQITGMVSKFTETATGSISEREKFEIIEQQKAKAKQIEIDLQNAVDHTNVISRGYDKRISSLKAKSDSYANSIDEQQKIIKDANDEIQNLRRKKIAARDGGILNEGSEAIEVIDEAIAQEEERSSTAEGNLKTLHKESAIIRNSIEHERSKQQAWEEAQTQKIADIRNRIYRGESVDEREPRELQRDNGTGPLDPPAPPRPTDGPADIDVPNRIDRFSIYETTQEEINQRALAQGNNPEYALAKNYPVYIDLLKEMRTIQNSYLYRPGSGPTGPVTWLRPLSPAPTFPGPVTWLRPLSPAPTFPGKPDKTREFATAQAKINSIYIQMMNKTVDYEPIFGGNAELKLRELREVYDPDYMPLTFEPGKPDSPVQEPKNVSSALSTDYSTIIGPRGDDFINSIQTLRKNLSGTEEQNKLFHSMVNVYMDAYTTVEGMQNLNKFAKLHKEQMNEQDIDKLKIILRSHWVTNGYIQ